MNCLSRGIRYQMGIPHGHGNGFMPHQPLDAVYVSAANGQPTGKGVSEAVKNDTAGSVVRFEPIIEAEAVNKVSEGMCEVTARKLAQNRGKNESDVALFANSPARLENGQRPIVQRHFAAGLSVCFITHGQHRMGHVNVWPLHPAKLAQAKAGIQRQDDAVVHITVRELFGCSNKIFGFLGREKALTGIADFGHLDAQDWGRATEDFMAMQFCLAGQVIEVAEDATILLDSGRCSARAYQRVNDRLDVVTRDRTQRPCAEGRFEHLIEALLISEPTSLGAFSIGEIILLKKVLQKHIGCMLFSRLLFSRRTLFGGILPHFCKAKRPLSCFLVFFYLGQDLVCFFRIPALSGPSHGFFYGAAILHVADGEEAICLAIALLPGGMLVIAHTGVLCLDLLPSHAPNMPPVLGVVKGSQGNDVPYKHVDFIAQGKSGESFKQIQGLVLAREWEFESPLRHHLLRVVTSNSL